MVQTNELFKVNGCPWGIQAPISYSGIIPVCKQSNLDALSEMVTKLRLDAVVRAQFGDNVIIGRGRATVSIDNLDIPTVIKQVTTGFGFTSRVTEDRMNKLGTLGFQKLGSGQRGYYTGTAKLDEMANIEEILKMSPSTDTFLPVNVMSLFGLSTFDRLQRSISFIAQALTPKFLNGIAVFCL